MPRRIKYGGDDEVYCLFWLFLRQSGATVILTTVEGAITPPITMVAITIIGALDGDTVIAGGGGARRIINDPDFGRLRRLAVRSPKVRFGSCATNASTELGGAMLYER